MPFTIVEIGRFDAAKLHVILYIWYNMKEDTALSGFNLLRELALDLSWSWSHRTDRIWRELDNDLWDFTYNPWIVLQTISREKLQDKLRDPNFRIALDDLIKLKREESQAVTWFGKTYPHSSLNSVAYFSMEFMLSEALPIYSGGLGNVAGDQLKSASDLGIPVVGISLLYSEGYFRQMINKQGYQQAFYPFNDPGQLPIQPLRKYNGEWIRVQVALPGWSVWLRAWEVIVGRTKLYLLDSNDAANYPAHRGITSELYGGDVETRLKQELVLGIGGWRLLEQLDINPQVCHLNEGHAAFAILERTKSFMQKTKTPCDVAFTAVRAGNLFTTHTAVAAGFDHFSPALIDQYLGKYVQEQLGISVDTLLGLGRKNPNDKNEYFNMAYFAIRGSGAVNGVSKLHGKVSRHLFSPLFDRCPEDEVPIGSVTNGVHVPSWDSAEADELWTESCGKNRWLSTTENLEKKIREISDEKLWKLRNESRHSLIDFARVHISRQLMARGESSDLIDQVKNWLNPNYLTLGFARRFATYKRPDLLLHDEERFSRILYHSERPIQLIIAGKAHPADLEGQAQIHRWIQFIRQRARTRVIFLGDYDMHLTEKLVQGVDVWINTPRRPWEASGTSGMKILVNGGINLSELDGWWAEAYTPQVGWALGDGKEHGEDPAWDAYEANALYALLEQQVIPEFYTRNDKGIPVTWIGKIRESMAQLTPQFSANRTVREYIDRYYLPAAQAYQERTENHAELSKGIVAWQQAIEKNWPNVHFGKVNIETHNDQYHFESEVYLNGLTPDQVKVELFANPLFRLELTMSSSSNGNYVYRTAIPAKRPISDYTLRIIPYHPKAIVPLENTHVLWQR